ncbi:MAG: type 4 prepilin-like proteins leader peptide-processing enzyme [Hyphobacterium sp.]|nr:MAG: type 4 prepilin-like proteins leader peptide-processing enzyme [Hyphobacterium sp.]
MIDGYLDVFLILAGAFVGSFITASAKAWPDWSQIVSGRSACAHCGQKLSPWELIPIVSFIILRGRCRNCKTDISGLHPIGEAAALVIAISAVIAFDGWATLLAVLFGWMLLFGALVDIRTFLIPDVVSVGLIPTGLLVTFFNAGQQAALMHAFAAIIGFASLAIIAVVYRYLRGREGLGMGDAKLLAAGGAWAGLYALPWIVAIGAGATLLIVAIGHVLGRQAHADSAVPLGPGLAAGCYLAYSLPSFVQQLN